MNLPTGNSTADLSAFLKGGTRGMEGFGSEAHSFNADCVATATLDFAERVMRRMSVAGPPTSTAEQDRMFKEYRAAAQREIGAAVGLAPVFFAWIFQALLLALVKMAAEYVARWLLDQRGRSYLMAAVSQRREMGSARDDY